MSTRGKLRRRRRRLICRLIGHDWGEWEVDPTEPSNPTFRRADGVLLFRPPREYRECQRCPKMDWRQR